MKGRGIALVALATAVLAGCGGPAARAPAADSPLAPCANPGPARPAPLRAPLARDFAGGRVRTAFSLDGGAFQAIPAPASARPQVSASLALCSLLAGATADGYTMVSAAAQSGMSFGLGVVTVASSVLTTGPRRYFIAGQDVTASLRPYQARLAWIAVTIPEASVSCPAARALPAARGAAPSAPAASAAPPAAAPLPGYQVLALDASGAGGILYSARASAPCGRGAGIPPSVAPAAEFVSQPWRLVSRGPGPQSAIISYQSRPCDQPRGVFFAGTGQPAVFASRTDPALVSVTTERVLGPCGAASTTRILLRSSTVTTDLPGHLVHAATGAVDVPAPN